MAFTIAFSVSLTALVLFMAFKMLEHSQTMPSYVAFRKKGDKIVVATMRKMRSRSNRLEQQLSARNIVNVTTHHVASAIARTARSVETRAQDVTRKMARNGNGEVRTTKSSFLKQVTTHKENLDTDRVRRETSLVDNTEK